MEFDTRAASDALDELISTVPQSRNSSVSSAIRPRKVNVQQPEQTPEEGVDRFPRATSKGSFRPNEPQQFSRDTRKTSIESASPLKATTISGFLDCAKGISVVECKPVEASGTGASSVFIRDTQTDTGRRLSSPTLPFKAWLTKTSICPEPYVIVRVPHSKIRQHLKVLQYLSETSDDNSSREASVVITVLFEKWSGVAQVKEFDITVRTAENLEATDSVCLGEVTLASPKEVAHVPFPLSALSEFVKIDIRPRTTSTWLVKISGICVWIPSRQGASFVSQKLPSSQPWALHADPRETVAVSADNSTQNVSSENSSRAGARQHQDKMSSSDSSAPRRDDSMNTSVPVRDAFERRQQSGGIYAGMNVSTKNEQNDVSQDHTCFPESPDPVRLQAGIAAEMRDRAVFLLRRNLTDGKKHEPPGECFHHQSKRVYDWLRDEMRSVERLAAAAQPNAVDVAPRRPGTLTLPDDCTFTEFMQTWEMAPYCSVKEGLQFGMNKSLSFSYTIAQPDDPRGLAAVLRSAFSFNVLSLQAFSGNGHPDSTATPVALQNTPLQQLVNMISVGDQLEKELQLLFQVPGGFVVRLFPKSSIYGSNSKGGKFVMVVCESDGNHNAALEESVEIHTSKKMKFVTPLRCVLDFTSSFSAILPALEKWAVAKEIEYYGVESQSPLTQFITQSCCQADERAVKDNQNSLSGNSRVIHLNELQLTASKTSMTSEPERPGKFACFTLRHCSSQFYTWQGSGTPTRVLLTNNHLFEHFHALDGCLATEDVLHLGRTLFQQDLRRRAELDSKMVVVSEVPLLELLENTRRSTHVGSSEPRGTGETWLESRRRATSKLIFYALSTAYRREWRTIGICLPYQCCTQLPAPLFSANGILDEDELMNTVLRWNFSKPANLIIFYGHCQPAWDSGNSKATAFPPFSEDSLSLFASRSKLSAAMQ